MAYQKKGKLSEIKYPTLDEVRTASDGQIRRWYDGELPSPDMKNESQIDVMNLVIKRNRAIKKSQKVNS